MNAFQVMMTSSKKKSQDSKKKKSVFDVLMSNRTTKSTTKSKRKGRTPIFKRKKKSKQKSFPPKHKRVKLTKELLVLVDAFEYAIPHVQTGIVLNMLTHFHSDHYGGLDKNYSSKVQILCNEITGNLAAQELRVCKSNLRILPMNTYVPLSNRVDVAMIDGKSSHLQTVSPSLVKSSTLTHTYSKSLPGCGYRSVPSEIEKGERRKLSICSTYR